jgi:hypothetical protein
MRFRPFFLLLALPLLLASCGDNEAADDPSVEVTPEPVNDNTISTDFGMNSFSGNAEPELLKEIGICDPAAANDTDEKLSACTPKFFRFFRLTEQKPLRDGFILLVKAGVGGFPTRRVLVFEREKETLVKVNGFAGNLIERRRSATGYDDLVVRFGDRIEGNLYFYNCLFEYKEGKYVYRTCEAINDSRVKPEYMDSMAVEIKRSLDQNRMIF